MNTLCRTAFLSSLISVFLSSVALGQSDYAKFLESSTGALDMREIKISGSYAGAKVSARSLTRVRTGENRKAVFLTKGGGVTGPEEFFVYLDQDELPEVIAFIKDVEGRFESAPKPDQLLTYRTRSGLYIGGHYYGKWKGVVGTVHDGLNEMGRSDLKQLREELEEAQTALAEGF